MPIGQFDPVWTVGWANPVSVLEFDSVMQACLDERPTWTGPGADHQGGAA